jgi:hypothetical protein
MERDGMTDSWVDLIGVVVADAHFHPPAQAGAFAEVEGGLGLSLPDQLKGLPLETNGLVLLISAQMSCGR